MSAAAVGGRGTVVRRTLGILTALFATLWLPLSPRTAFASHTEVDTTLDAQSYLAPSPYGNPVVRRRRFTHTLGLGYYDILDDPEASGPQLSLVARMRLDADFGQSSAERSPNRLDRYSPGLEEAPFDLMYAYVDARRYADGWLGGRLGRQYQSDVLGWWSFDGALLRITTPVYLRLEGYGGFEQRGGLHLVSTPRFSADGVYRGDREGLDVNQWPSYLDESRLAPAYGVALETHNVEWMHARVSYRQVINRDRVLATTLFDTQAEPEILRESRTSTERVGASLFLTEPDVGSVNGRAVYDLYNQLLSEHAAGLSWYLNERITLSLEYDYFMPTFDGDSVFNWFTHRGMTTWLGRGSWRLARRVDLSTSAGVRQFRTEGDPDEHAERLLQSSATSLDRSQTGAVIDALGSAALRYGWGLGNVLVSGRGEGGGSGHSVGGDVTARQRFGGGYFDTLAIVSLYDWHNALRAGRDATSFGYVLGGGISPAERTRLGVEWEHDMNRLVGQRYRVLGTVTVATSR